jgi:hypothetical protein
LTSLIASENGSSDKHFCTGLAQQRHGVRERGFLPHGLSSCT